MRRTRPLPAPVAAFDARLRAFLRDPEARALAGYNWTEGGCGILALALAAWLGSETALVGVFGYEDETETDVLHHVVLALGPWYLDGRGASRRAELLETWFIEEDLVSPSLAPVTAAALRRAHINTVAETVRAVTRLLDRHLGPGAEARRILGATV